MTKWPVQKQTHSTTHKHVEHQDKADIKKKYSFCMLKNGKVVHYIVRYAVIFFETSSCKRKLISTKMAHLFSFFNHENIF